MSISKTIKQRIVEAGPGHRYNSNDNISEFIKPGELDLMIEEVTGKFQGVLESLVIDTENDWNTQDTARRVAKMFCTEVFAGRYVDKPKVTAFPNATKYDQLYVTGPITIRSVCAHHMMPIIGKCYVGVFPGDKVIGLSKFTRLIDWVASRPTIQEEMTQQIADLIEEETGAEGIAVLIQAEHHCMTMRGVKEHESAMTTSIVRGSFRDAPHLKQEFFNIVATMP